MHFQPEDAIALWFAGVLCGLSILGLLAMGIHQFILTRRQRRQWRDRLTERGHYQIHVPRERIKRDGTW